MSEAEKGEASEFLETWGEKLVFIDSFVQEIPLKKKKGVLGGLLKSTKDKAPKSGDPEVDIIPRVLVFSTFRFWLFERKSTDKKAKRDSAADKRGRRGLQTLELLENYYLSDIVEIEHNGTTRFSVKVEGGYDAKRRLSTISSVITFRSDLLSAPVLALQRLWRTVCGASDRFLKVTGPAIGSPQDFQFTSLLEPYVNAYCSHCSQLNTPVNRYFITHLEYLEREGINELDFSQIPFVELVNRAPILQALTYNTYFKSLSIEDIPCREAPEVLSRVLLQNQSIHKLRLVNIDGDPLGFEALGQSLSDNKTAPLAYVDFSKNKLAQAGLQTFAQSFLPQTTNSLTYLNFERCQLSSLALVELVNLIMMSPTLSRSVEYINLGGCVVDTPVAGAFGTWASKCGEQSSLRRLMLANCQLDFSICLSLYRFPLREIDLSGNKIHDPLQLMYVVDMLKLTTTPKKFSLTQLNLNQDQGFLQPLLFVLETREDIDLNLSNNPALGAFFAENTNWRGFPNQFPGMKKLDFSYINSKEQLLETMLPAMTAFPHLEEINFEGIVKSKGPISDALDKAVRDFVSSHPALAKANLSNGLGRIALSFIEGLRQSNHGLSELDISNNGFGDEGAIAINDWLISNPSVTALDVSGNDFTHNGFFLLNEALRFNATLTKMTFSPLDIKFAAASITIPSRGESLLELYADIQATLKSRTGLKTTALRQWANEVANVFKPLSSATSTQAPLSPRAPLSNNPALYATNSTSIYTTNSVQVRQALNNSTPAIAIASSPPIAMGLPPLSTSTNTIPSDRTDHLRTRSNLDDLYLDDTSSPGAPKYVTPTSSASLSTQSSSNSLSVNLPLGRPSSWRSDETPPSPSSAVTAGGASDEAKDGGASSPTTESKRPLSVGSLAQISATVKAPASAATASNSPTGGRSSGFVPRRSSDKNLPTVPDPASNAASATMNASTPAPSTTYQARTSGYTRAMPIIPAKPGMIGARGSGMPAVPGPTSPTGASRSAAVPPTGPPPGFVSKNNGPPPPTSAPPPMGPPPPSSAPPPMNSPPPPSSAPPPMGPPPPSSAPPPAAGLPPPSSAPPPMSHPPPSSAPPPPMNLPPPSSAPPPMGPPPPSSAPPPFGPPPPSTPPPPMFDPPAPTEAPPSKRGLIEDDDDNWS